MPEDSIGLRARAVGAKTWPAFVRSSRAFILDVSSSNLSIEEWRKQGRTFMAADPLWRIELKPNELEKALGSLVRRIEVD